MRLWEELADLTKCFVDTSGDNDAWTCRQYCAKEGSYVNLSLINRIQQARGKDAVVYGLSPFALLQREHFLTDLLTYDPAPGQLMVMYSMESPLRVHKWISTFGLARYHVDMTYFLGSQISIPYGYYKPFDSAKESVTKMIDKNWASNKTGFITWIGSNCNKEVFWPRMDFINHLQVYADVDLYGKCGKLKCLPRLSQRCTKLMSKYKFYLAFENSECFDYITEKLWVNSFLHDIVPVVYGPPKSNYLKYAPPNSFIHIADFKSQKELVEYLQMLDKNDDLYNEFFKWKKKGEIIVNYPNIQPNYFCNILHYLKPDNFPADLKSVQKSRWYNSCREPIKRIFDPKKVKKLKAWTPWIEEYARREHV